MKAVYGLSSTLGSLVLYLFEMNQSFANNTQVASLLADSEAHQDQIRQLSYERDRVVERCDEITIERDKLLKVKESLEHEIGLLHTQVSEGQSYQAKLEHVQEEMGKCEAHNVQLVTKLEETMCALTNKSKELSEAEAEWELLKTDFENKHAELDKMWRESEDRLCKALADIGKAKEEHGKVATELREVAARADDFAARWSASCVELSRVEGDNNALKAEHTAIRTEVLLIGICACDSSLFVGTHFLLRQWRFNVICCCADRRDTGAV